MVFSSDIISEDIRLCSADFLSQVHHYCLGCLVRGEQEIMVMRISVCVQRYAGSSDSA